MFESTMFAAVVAFARPHAGGIPWAATSIRSLAGQVERLLNAPVLRGAQIGLLMQDTTRDRLLYTRNADEEFMPASNFKLLTGSAALQRLGPDFSYVTRVDTDGALASGVLDGNVYLRGGGDALLSAADLDAAAESLAARGVRSVTGSVVADASHDDDQRYGFGWSWDDLPYYYAPVVSALELEDGVAHVYVSPGAAPGDPVRVRVVPQSSAYAIDNEMITGAAGSKDTSDISRVWDAPRTIRLLGSYPLGAKESEDMTPSVPDPPSYAADVFARALRAHGIPIGPASPTGKTPPDARVLWTHHSEPLTQLLADFWYPSDNLMGELLLKELGVAARGEPGTDEHGATVERAFLRSIGVDPQTVAIADGSGLSQYDRITPRDLVAILQADWNGPERDIVLDALPVAGVRGTLREAYAGTPAAKAVWAKTGSMSHVRTLSGFVQTRTHGVVTFSLLINQWMGEDTPSGAEELARVRGALLSAIAVQ